VTDGIIPTCDIRLVAADEDTVRDVIHLFNAKGLAALDPRLAGGRPRLTSDHDIGLGAFAGLQEHINACLVGVRPAGAMS
jgi:hypothetical protein